MRSLLKRLFVSAFLLTLATLPALAQVNIAPNNAALIYTPYNWNVGASASISINSAAGFRTMFSGTTCTLNFNVSGDLTPLPQIYVRVSGTPNQSGTGGWTMYTLASTIPCTPPPLTTSSGQPTDPESPTTNFLEVKIKAVTQQQNRWSGVAAAVNFTGITLATGAVVYTPSTYPMKIAMFGTSITEGVQTYGLIATGADNTSADGTVGWADLACQHMNAECGIVGFGGSGWTATGNGSIPPAPTIFTSVYSGVPRVFTGNCPNLFWFDYGYNDGTVNTIPNVTTTMNEAETACPTTPIVVMEEFPLNPGSVQRVYIPAGIAMAQNPAMITYWDTTGIWNPAWSSDALHSWGNQNLDLLAPAVANEMYAVLAKYNGGARGFVNGFRR